MNIRECSFKYAKLNKRKMKDKEVKLEARITEIQKLVEHRLVKRRKKTFNG